MMLFLGTHYSILFIRRRVESCWMNLVSTYTILQKYKLCRIDGQLLYSPNKIQLINLRDLVIEQPICLHNEIQLIENSRNLFLEWQICLPNNIQVIKNLRGLVIERSDSFSWTSRMMNEWILKCFKFTKEHYKKIIK